MPYVYSKITNIKSNKNYSKIHQPIYYCFSRNPQRPLAEPQGSGEPRLRNTGLDQTDKSVVRPTRPINLTCCSFYLLFSFFHCFLLVLHDDSRNKINKNATECQSYRTTRDNCVTRCVLHTSFHRIRTARLLCFMRGEIRPMTCAGLVCD